MPKVNSALELARVALDDALVRLPALDDPESYLPPIAEALGQALRGVYRALGHPGDAALFAEASQDTQEATARALDGLQRVADERDPQDEALQGVLRLTADALATLRQARYDSLADPLPLAPTPAPNADAPVPATLGVPRLLPLAREVLLPRVPLLEGDAPEPDLPLQLELAPPEKLTDLAALERLMAETESAMAAAEQPPEQSVAEQPPEQSAAEQPPEQSAAEQPRPEASPFSPPPAAAPPDAALVEELRFGSRLAPAAILAERARIALEDLGTLGAQRRPGDSDGWLDSVETERRLLTRIDALVACGTEQLSDLALQLSDRPVADPELTYALILLYGSLSGQDAADQALRLARCGELDDPDVSEAVVDALALSPHSGLVPRLQGLLSHDSPSLRAVSLRVLARRGALQSQEVARAALDSEVEVVRAAAWAFRFVDSDRGSRRPLDMLFSHDDEDVARDALWSALLCGDASPLRFAIELCSRGRGGHADAALIVALSAPRDALPVLQAAGDGAAVVAACGYFGHLDRVDFLFERFANGDDECKIEAAAALYRLSGVCLTDDEKEPRFVKGEEPFADGYREPQRVVELTLDDEAWRRVFERHLRRARPGERYRYGCAWTPAHNLWELAHELSPLRDRVAVYAELVARLGLRLRLDPYAFISTQRAQLAAIRDQVAARPARGSTPWPTRLL